MGAALLVLTGCIPGSTSPAVAPDPRGVRTAAATSVSDGDTLLVDNGSATLQLRLAGINAPEADECHHEESGDHLRTMVEGREIEFEVVDIDQFGRSLAHIWLDGLHVNKSLVAEGYAIATSPDGDTRVADLIEAEAAAARQGLGIWAEDACGRSDPLPPIRIEAVRPDPSGRDEQDLGGEQVTLSNDGDDGIDLSGWMLRDESSRHRYEFPDGTWLGSGESVTVTSGDPEWRPGGSPVWNNGGDLVMVLDPSGRVVDHLRY